MTTTADLVLVPAKACSHCKAVKELTEYNVNKRAKDGRHAICRACHAAKLKARRAATKGQVAPAAQESLVPELPAEPTKACSACKEEKPLTAFHTDRSRPDGHTTQCKDCRNARRARR